MSEVRQAIDMQRMAEQQVQQTARNLPMAPAPVRAVPTRALTVEERYQRAEEEERLREEERLMRNRAEDAAAAAALARQFEEEEERIRREHEELMSNVQKIFECSVCMDEHPEEDLACVEMCGHKFGRECLRDFIISKIDQRSYPIVCPVCIAEQNRNGGRERVGSEFFSLICELPILMFVVSYIQCLGGNGWHRRREVPGFYRIPAC